MSVKVFDALSKGNYQARVIKDISPFKEGMDVDLMLTDQDTVYVVDIGEELGLKEEYNLDTHADYDKYFRIY